MYMHIPGLSISLWDLYGAFNSRCYTLVHTIFFHVGRKELINWMGILVWSLRTRLVNEFVGMCTFWSYSVVFMPCPLHKHTPVLSQLSSVSFVYYMYIVFVCLCVYLCRTTHKHTSAHIHTPMCTHKWTYTCTYMYTVWIHAHTVEPLLTLYQPITHRCVMVSP